MCQKQDYEHVDILREEQQESDGENNDRTRHDRRSHFRESQSPCHRYQWIDKRHGKQEVRQPVIFAGTFESGVS